MKHESVRSPRSRRHWLARASLAVAALASAATSYDYGHGGATLINHRHFPLTAHVADGPVVDDCDFFNIEDARLLTRSHFQSQRRIELSPMTYEPLGYDACGMVWLTIEGEFDGVIAWKDLLNPTDGSQPIDHELITSSVTVEGSKDELRVTVGEQLEWFAAPGGERAEDDGD
jgi:hypothetical protein